MNGLCHVGSTVRTLFYYSTLSHTSDCVAPHGSGAPGAVACPVPNVLLHVWLLPLVAAVAGGVLLLLRLLMLPLHLLLLRVLLLLWQHNHAYTTKPSLAQVSSMPRHGHTP